MNLQSCIENMRIIQKGLLEFIDNEEDIEENFQNLIKIFKDHKIFKNKHKIKSILYIILNIANNHHRCQNFFDKIEKILLSLKDDIKQTLSNHELFEIYKKQKRILLFLYEEKMIEFDKNISDELVYNKKNSQYLFSQYFYDELKPFLSKTQAKSSRKKISENSETLKKLGNNESQICEIIRQGSLADFMSHVSTYSVPLTSNINESAYETNSFLIKNKASLVEYAAFCGSVEIMKYLIEEKVQIRPLIYLFAIHSGNMKIFEALEENKIEFKNEMYSKFVKESIKSHHIEFIQYINEKINKKIEIKVDNIAEYSLHYYNFLYFPNENIYNSNNLYILAIEYDHFNIVELLLKNKAVDINYKTIDKLNIFNQVMILNFIQKVFIYLLFKYSSDLSTF